MSMPWDTSAPVPVTAMNPETGEQVRVDVSENLRQAIKDAINATVMENRPALVGAVKTHPVILEAAKEFAQLTLLHGAAIDLAVAVVAGCSTIIAPDSTATTVLWFAAGVLAVKTVVQAAVGLASGMKP